MTDRGQKRTEEDRGHSCLEKALLALKTSVAVLFGLLHLSKLEERKSQDVYGIWVPFFVHYSLWILSPVSAFCPYFEYFRYSHKKWKKTSHWQNALRFADFVKAGLKIVYVVYSEVGITAGRDAEWDLNPRTFDWYSNALPTESSSIFAISGGLLSCSALIVMNRYSPLKVVPSSHSFRTSTTRPYWLNTYLWIVFWGWII